MANPGVTWTFCETCASPLTGRDDYLPGKVYIAVSLLDQTDDFAQELHAHVSKKLEWLDIDDDLKRFKNLARERLLKA